MAEWADWQNVFYQQICVDSRISPTHISLYFALLHEAGHTHAFPFYLRRDPVGRKAKIFSRVTLNRCLRELDAYGYIVYKPSFTPGCSVVELVALVPGVNEKR